MMRRSSSLLSILFLVFVLSATAVASDTKSPEGIPPELERWKDWVLHGQESLLCPTRYDGAGTHLCNWPSPLKLSLEGKGGEFSQEWLVLSRGWAPLPGGSGVWPKEVTVDGVQAPVVEKDGRPVVHAAPGKHQLKGSFSWDEMPEILRIPTECGLIQLTVDGKPVDFPEIDEDARLWLKKRREVAGEEDRLEVSVYRLFKDSVPMQVRNVLRVNVAGQAREIQLEGVLLQGAIPMRLSSGLPARIDQGGNVTLQARPGRYEIQIDTWLPQPVYSLGPVKAPFGKEIWAFDAQNHLRMVEVQGVPAIDPGQTDSPKDWKELQTFVVQPGAEVRFKETRRGDPDPAPNQLDLKRTWWLDFDGRGYTIQDRITGTISREWTLSMNPPIGLGRVADPGGKGMVITDGALRKKPSVELRSGQCDLVADSRIEGPLRELPAVGWDQDFKSMSGALNLPPGWRLLTVRGVDVMPGTWFEQWTLLDLFLVFIIAMSVWQLWSRRWGLLALLGLLLIYHEPGAPRLVWLHLLAATALMRFLPSGRLKKGVKLWWLGSAVALIAISMPFMAQQVRFGIYPQLEQPVSGDLGIFPGGMAGAPEIPRQRKGVAPAPMAEVQRESAPVKKKWSVAELQDEQALIQTGPGVPSWRWRVLEMEWNGPVNRNQRVQLWLLSPQMNLLLAIFRVVLLAGLIWGLVRRLRPTGQNSADGPPPGLNLCIGLFMAWSLAMSGTVLAMKPPEGLSPKATAGAQTREGEADVPWESVQSSPQDKKAAFETPTLGHLPSAVSTSPGPFGFYPPPDILMQLKERLLKKPECLPHCAESPRMVMALSPDGLSLVQEVHAAAQTAVPLPGSAKTWLPDRVVLDDRSAEGLLRDREGVLWILVSKGVHRLVMSGKLPQSDSFQIPLHMRPRHVSVEKMEGWKVHGVGKEGEAEQTILFVRLREEGASREAVKESALEPFFQITRMLELGIEWTVRTTVERVTDKGVPVVLAVPLIQGETLTTAGIRVQQGEAQIHMGAHESEVQWVSSLEAQEEGIIRLVAPKSGNWTEVWRLEASPIWHCELEGIPAVHHQESGEWGPKWQPWPGESVVIKVSRPKPMQGQVVTIDSAKMEWTPGERFHKASLTLQMRSSKGGRHEIILPENAELQGITVDGRSLPISPKVEKGKGVSFPLQPKTQQVWLEWRLPSPSSPLLNGPAVDLGMQAVNAAVSLHMPVNQWILWAKGPRLGPAVLFWSTLVVILLVAVALGRIGWTPLRTHHWFLLGLGLTQVHSLVAILIAGWLLVLGWRGKHQVSRGWFAFDVIQVLLVVWTAAALVGLYDAVHEGLLGIPDMQIAGNGSSNWDLHWTQDRIEGPMPQPWVLSLPMFVYRSLMLLWALWLAQALLRWLRWGWRCFGENGFWRKVVLRRADTKSRGGDQAIPENTLDHENAN